MKNNNDIRMNGLSAVEVSQSRMEHGENVLSAPRRRSLWRLYLEKYEDPIIRILLVAAAVSLCLAFVNGEFVETIGIILAILFATTVGFYFERDAARKFDVLTAMGEEQMVKVLRDGKVQEVARRDIVVGDVVLVETGDEVPADGILFEAVDMQVDESSLTGEMLTNKEVRGARNEERGRRNEDSSRYEVRGARNEDSSRNEERGARNEDSSDSKGNEAYPKDVLLRSSMVMNGTGRMQVTAVGDATEIGKVAREATELTMVKTPLNQQLDRLAKLISKIGSAVSILAFLAFLLHDVLTDDLWHTDDYVGMAAVVLRYFMMAVTLIVMAVPEGLPMAVTLALALNMRRMLKSNNLVRKLQASETMGAVTVICTDKTGTLTENKMTVVEVRGYGGTEVRGYEDSSRCEVRGTGYEDSSRCEEQLALAIALNSTAELNGEEGIGNPTEVALLRYIQQQGADYQALRRKAEIIERVPFSTERKYMSTTVRIDGTSHVFVKGAPEVVLGQTELSSHLVPRTSYLESEPSSHPRTPAPPYPQCEMTDVLRRQIEDELLGWQQRAMRTLAFTCDGHFLAIVAISDPVRADVPKAVANCRRAGIEVKMVTGDTEATAIEIGRQIGLIDGADISEQQVITGVRFAALSDEEASQRVASLKVMSRARPSDKQRLVQLLQKCGEVVAVTGDGTNDAPALNYAHVGLSLGSGTSVAKEASDITLLDNSFRSVVSAVEWGRSLYKNIQRFIFFQLVVNVTALLLVLGGSIIGTQLPLTVTQILWINLIMDTFAAMALASLPPSHEVLDAAPRKATDFIITASMKRGIIGIGLVFFIFTFGYLYWLENNDSGDGMSVYELTKFFTFFVMLQWWNLFNARTLGSHHSAFHHFFWCKGFVLVLMLILLGQWLIVELGGDMFRTEPIAASDWLNIIVGTSPVMIIGEIYRAWCRRKQ